MKANVGGIDRILRILVGVGILATGAFFHSYWGFVGLLPLLTGLFRFCPAYPLIGLNTCARPDDDAK